jgi:hypothetical protein
VEKSILIKKGEKKSFVNEWNKYGKGKGVGKKGNTGNKNRKPWPGNGKPGKPKKPYMGIPLNTPEECLAAVKKNGLMIRNIEVQPEDLCIEAVRQTGLALKFIKNRYKTAKICVIAVGQNGLALKHVNVQSEKICMTAIRQNPMAMEYVTEKTPEMREIARKRFNDWLDSLK